jgi:hypothetical protein
VWRKLVVTVLVLSIFPLGHGVSSQAAELRVWAVLGEDDVAVVEGAVGAFASNAGVQPVVRVLEAPYLLQAVVAARDAGEPGPDVIFAPTDVAEPLLENALIRPTPAQGPFFLEALLEALPGLLDEACGDRPLDECLWEPVAPSLPAGRPDERSMARAAAWVCESAPGLPMCKGDPLPGQPVTWGYQIFLFNQQWLAERGLEPPVLVDDAFAIRSKFGLDVLRPTADELPLAEDVPQGTIVVISSAALTERPQETLRTLGSFFAAGYVPVLGLTFDTMFVAAGSANPDLAEQFARTAAQDSALKAGLTRSSGRLPVFVPEDLLRQGLDEPETRAVLQALAVLAAYAQIAY